MIHENVEINIDYEALGIKHDNSRATITTYIKEMYPNDQNPFKRPLVIVCPGGGYHHHSPREGEAIAIKMLELGMNAVVLRYSLCPNEFPCQLYEAVYVIDYVRKHAEQWDVDPDKIIVAGFSAGGHVAASLGTLYDQDEVAPMLDILKLKPKDIRPDGLLLGYPVITSGEKAHKMSFERLLGSRHSQLLDSVSLENRVKKGMPSAFIWHTFSDNSVPVENSILFANAMRRADVPFELHIFPCGNHGLGLGTKETDTKDGTHFQPEVNVWTGMFKTWVENNI